MTNAQKLLLLLLAGCLAVFAERACASDYPVEYLGIEQGLSNNAVTGICKDDHGFIWIATYDGLNRYDGSAVSIFRNVWGDSTSLNNNHVNRVVALGNKIFVGTQSGLVYYSYNDSRFHPVFYTGERNARVQKITSNVSTLKTGSNGQVYIGTDYNGFFIYNDRTGSCRQVSIGANNRTYSVQGIEVDAQNNTWLFVRDVGLCRYNRQTSQLDVVNADLKSAICLTADGNRIWIGTDNGLYSYDKSAHRTSRFHPEGIKLSSQNIVDVKYRPLGNSG